MMKSMTPNIGITALMLFLGGESENHVLIMLRLSLYTIANTGISATIFKYMFDALPLPIRCTGSSFIYSLSVAIVGGTAPIFAAFLINANYLMSPAYYVCLFGLFAFISISKDPAESSP
ncbi:hypothetical protein [Shewanella surugensis]|uniref:MFS transporter n=1 Tax=Shewanella surugensis TaxID=212020 RepID=A0ABT0LH60_9GAMM|nr:hypothetical protein [Shewanella surugensis]MCL1127048.1 hypothetical protein [Shewanella surugensis]